MAGTISNDDAWGLYQAVMRITPEVAISGEWRDIADNLMALDPDVNRFTALDTFLNGHGPKVKEAILQAHPPTPDPNAIQPFRVYSPDELTDLADPEWLIDGILVENTFAALVGAQASLKSFMALDMAACLGDGLPWQGRRTKQGASLFVVGEGRGGLSKRIRAWEQHHGRSMSNQVQVIVDPVILGQDMRRPVGRNDADRLIATIQSLKYQPSAIWLDTVARSMGSADENSTRDMGAFVQVIDTVRASCGASFVGLHHMSRAGTTRGNTAFGAALDTELVAKRSGDTVVLECTKQKDGAEFQPITLRKEIVELSIGKDGKPTTSVVVNRVPDTGTSTSTFATKLLDLLISHFGKAGASATQWLEVAESQDVSRASFYRARTELVEERGLVKLDNRKYHAV